MKGFSAKKIAYIGVICAMSLLTFIIEGLLPPLFLPGAKLGLSNVFVLLSIVAVGNVESIMVVIIKTVLGSLITGSLSSLMYSLTAGLASAAAGILLYRFVFPKISLLAISITAAVVHNTVQTAVFCLITNTPSYFMYLGYLILIGIAAGAVTGAVVIVIIRYVPSKIYAGLSDKTTQDQRRV